MALDDRCDAATAMGRKITDTCGGSSEPALSPAQALPLALATNHDSAVVSAPMVAEVPLALVSAVSTGHDGPSPNGPTRSGYLMEVLYGSA